MSKTRIWIIFEIERGEEEDFVQSIREHWDIERVKYGNKEGVKDV